MLRPLSVKSPSTTVMIEITIATIGRRMKNSATRAPLLRGLRRDRLRAHDQPVTYPCQAVDHDRLAALQPVVDDPVVVDTRPGLDGADARRVVGADGRDLVGPLRLLDGTLRDGHGVVLGLEYGAHLGELAGTQEAVRVREQAD